MAFLPTVAVSATSVRNFAISSSSSRFAPRSGTWTVLERRIRRWVDGTLTTTLRR